MNNIQEELRKLLIEDIRTSFLERQDYELCQIGSIDLLETALVGTGCFLDTEEMETNGWEQDWWANIVDEKTKEVVAEANGSMYYGNISFNFVNDES